MSESIQSLPFEILPEAPRYEWSVIQSRFADSSSINVRDILPYKKIPAQLSTEQLRELINEAYAQAWRVLDLSNYKIKSMPDEIGRLKNLEVLILGGEHDHTQYANTFDQLPDTIGNMTNLKVLAINNVPLTKLTGSLSKLTQLQYLDVSGNKYFETFPEVIFTLANLRVLRISYTYFGKKKLKPYDIPKQLAQLKMLQRLFIGGERFTALPDEIGDLLHLEHLSVYRTHIELLPDAISNSRVLKALVLFENRIRSLPESIGDISSLTTLKLTGEYISHVPRSMTKLSNLTEFTVKNTPLDQKIPPSIQMQSPKSMIAFLLSIQNEDIEKASPNESKMIIVGQGGVGKTSLLNRLKYNTFTEDPSTLGIDVKTWTINEGTEAADAEKILHIWDFGGQEIYHATHQFFLSERSLYVLVWDARQDKDYGRIDYWLNTIKLYAKDSPVFMVVNKYDGATPEPKMDIEKYKELFPNLELPLYKISCKDNKNIDELRVHLQKKAGDLPLMHQDWPKSWITVRKFLHDLYKIKHKHYIDYEEYLKICENQNLNDDDAETLIRCLHDLGIVLCFRNDSVLKHKVILEKEWGTKAFYEVLNFRHHRNGVINYEDLNTIWTDQNVYPVEMRETLLQLMYRFQLSFKIERRNQFLVVDLLRSRSLPPPEGFSQGDALHFRCQYSFLPTGVMSRFIVASHEYILENEDGKLCWLKGAYLQDGNDSKAGKAKIELFDGASEGYIDIKVWQDEKEIASEFLNKIRRILMGINKTIPFVEYEEMLRCNCEPGCIHFYKYNTLCLYRDKGRDYIICERTISEVNIVHLLNSYGL